MSKKRLYSAFGRKQTLDEWGSEYGIHPSTLFNRMWRKKISLEEALVVARRIESVATPLNAFGKSQPLATWAAEYNLNLDTLRRRLKTRTLEDALSMRKYERRDCPARGARRAAKHAAEMLNKRNRAIVRAVEHLAQRGDTHCIDLIAAVEARLIGK